MRHLVIILIIGCLMVVSLAFATCRSSATPAAEKYYEPVEEQWKSIEVPLASEADMAP